MKYVGCLVSGTKGWGGSVAQGSGVDLRYTSRKLKDLEPQNPLWGPVAAGN